MTPDTTTGHAWAEGRCVTCSIPEPRPWAEPCADPERVVAYVRVPTNRLLLPNDGDRLNIGTHHVNVYVTIDPDLPTLGKHESLYGGDRITLREWNEQVLLHEMLHVVVGRAGLDRTEGDPHLHNVISRVEVALWEAGWRWYPAQPVGDDLAYRFRHQAETKAAAEQEIAAALSPTPSECPACSGRGVWMDERCSDCEGES